VQWLGWIGGGGLGGGGVVALAAPSQFVFLCFGIGFHFFVCFFNFFFFTFFLVWKKTLLTSLPPIYFVPFFL
jgi:hypothetical protein